METLTLGWSSSKEGNRNSCSHESGGVGGVDAVAGEERHVVTRREPGSEGEPGHFDVDVKIGIQPIASRYVCRYASTA